MLIQWSGTYIFQSYYPLLPSTALCNTPRSRMFSPQAVPRSSYSTPASFFSLSLSLFHPLTLLVAGECDVLFDLWYVMKKWILFFIGFNDLSWHEIQLVLINTVWPSPTDICYIWVVAAWRYGLQTGNSPASVLRMQQERGASCKLSFRSYGRVW